MLLPSHPQSALAEHPAGNDYLKWLHQQQQQNAGGRRRQPQEQQQQQQQAAPAYDARRFEPYG